MYRLRWTEPFQQWLGTLWDAVSNDDRLRIANAINSLSHMLSHDPLANSESRGGQLRIAVEEPIALYFTVHFANDEILIVRGTFTP